MNEKKVGPYNVLLMKIGSFLKANKVDIILRFIILSIVAVIFLFDNEPVDTNSVIENREASKMFLLNTMTAFFSLIIVVIIDFFMAYIITKKKFQNKVVSKYLKTYNMLIPPSYAMIALLLFFGQFLENQAIDTQIIILSIIYLLISIGLIPLLVIYIISTSHIISEDELENNGQKHVKFIFKKELNILFVYVWYITSYIYIGYIIIYNNDNIIIEKIGIIIFVSLFVIIFIHMFAMVSYRYISLVKQPVKRMSSLGITNINIDTEVIKKSAIYILNDPKDSINNRELLMYTIPLSDFFPECSINEQLYIANSSSPKNFLYEDIESLNSFKNILLLFEFNSTEEFKLLELKINTSYVLNNIVINEFFHIFIEIREYAGVLIPTQKILFDHKKNECAQELTLDDFVITSNLDKANFYKFLLRASKNTIIYNDLDNRNYFNTLTLDNRKVVAHTKEYGVGKSSYDVHSIISVGKIPVVISPWESNFDHDILLLVFDTLRKETNTRFFEDNKNELMIYKFIFISAIFGFLSLSSNLLFEIIGKLNMSINYMKLSISEKEVIIMITISVLFGIIILLIDMWKQIIPRLLLFKKNGTMIHKDFYIDSIVNILNTKKDYVLIIEDVDRLEGKVINETFRIVSSINSKISKQNRYFALLSYSNNQLEKALEKESYDVDGIINKVVGKDDWGENYSVLDSMYKYCSIQIELGELYICEKDDISRQREVKYFYAKLYEQLSISVNHINFRDIYGISDEFITMIQEYDNEYVFNLESEYIMMIKKLKEKYTNVEKNEIKKIRNNKL